MRDVEIYAFLSSITAYQYSGDLDVETQNGLAAIGEDVGFDLAGSGIRRLDRDRRMRPARRGKEQRTQIEKRMHEEYVIGLLKH